MSIIYANEDCMKCRTQFDKSSSTVKLIRAHEFGGERVERPLLRDLSIKKHKPSIKSSESCFMASTFAMACSSDIALSKNYC